MAVSYNKGATKRAPMKKGEFKRAPIKRLSIK